MSRHQTPRTLNDNLRPGRLSVPQWVALAVGGLSLWLWGALAAGVRDPNAYILLTTIPTVLTVTPILALWRGGIERYPQQVVRYSIRRTVVYTRRGIALAYLYAQKGTTYAAVTIRQRRQRRA